MSLQRPVSQALRLLRPRLSNSPRLRNSPPFLSRGLVSKEPRESLDPITLHRLKLQRLAHYKRRTYYSAIGAVIGMIAIWVTATSIDLDAYPKPSKTDSGRRADDPLVAIGRERKVVVQKLGEEPEEKPDTVTTGTSTIPTFPRVLAFVDEEQEAAKDKNGVVNWANDDRLVEYQLMGLGVRTVSFLGIEVYVVGMYVATDDIATLQDSLVKKIAPGGSTLVAGEKDKLKEMLYDAEEGARIWNEVLRDSGVRTLVRIVPTKNTDFHHLRDAWVRGLTAKAQDNKEEYGDEVFGKSVAEFKTLFNRGSVPKGKELLLARDQRGKLAVWYDDGKIGAQRLGAVTDERISRVVWLNYLAGKSVASEPARKSIVEGVIEFVERPIGTVATQVQLYV